jgi:hypothetical protein
MQGMHNRVKAYLDGLPMPQVYRSKLQAICELDELIAARRVELITVWRAGGNPPDRKPRADDFGPA